MPQQFQFDINFQKQIKSVKFKSFPTQKKYKISRGGFQNAVLLKITMDWGMKNQGSFPSTLRPKWAFFQGIGERRGEREGSDERHTDTEIENMKGDKRTALSPE